MILHGVISMQTNSYVVTCYQTVTSTLRYEEKQANFVAQQATRSMTPREETREETFRDNDVQEVFESKFQSPTPLSSAHGIGAIAVDSTDVTSMLK